MTQAEPTGMQRRATGTLVALWLFFVPLSLGIGMPVYQRILQADMAGEPARLLRAGAGILMGCMSLFLVGVVQLRDWCLDIAIGLCAFRILATVGEVPRAVVAHPPAPYGLLMAGSVVGNGLAIWYLVARRRVARGQ